MITFTDADKALAEAVEAALKQASIDGVAGFTESVMTDEQYEPTTFPGVAATLPRDANRDIGIAVAYALRTVPVCLAQHFVASLPPPVKGGLIYVHNGAAGAPVVAFSDGTGWMRCDTRAIVTDI